MIFLAVTIGAVAWLATRPTSQPGRDAATKKVPQPAKVASAKPVQKPQQPTFAFYEMLPDYEVVIPGEMEKIRRRSQADENSASSASAQQSSANTQPPEASTEAAGGGSSEHYIIQVGAFTNDKDANQFRAKVTLLGLQARVVRAETESGQVIYRVRSKVINSGDRLAEMLDRLHAQDIETLVLRRSS